jgi:cyclophilin family peptidyl-prolyl cis-trans isomerase
MFATDVLRQLDEKYIKTGKIKFVYRYMAFLGSESQWAGEAAECANEQGKFWDYHDKLFASQKGENQGAFSKDNLKKFAADLKLDTANFNQCLDSGKFADKITKSNNDASQIGVNSTPTVFLNGIQIPLQYLGALDVLIPWLGWLTSNPRQFAVPDKVIDPAKKYTATVKTIKGDIVLELFADRTPTTVNNFVFLAKNKFYDGLTFHSVLPGADALTAQAGDPSGTGLGSPGFACNDELDSTLTFASEGVLAMANPEPNANGSQFFITLGPRPDLNGKQTIFGRVVSGMDVVKKLAPRDPRQDPSAPPGDAIQSVVVEAT